LFVRKEQDSVAHVWAPTANDNRGRVVVVGLIGLFLLYLVGIDQGFLLSIVQGQTAVDQNLIHEFVHDARHAAAFPCH
jgi:Probable cobalt transporter subunit (CbtB)